MVRPMVQKDDGRTVLGGKRYDAQHETGANVIRAGERKTAEKLKAAGASPASANWGGAGTGKGTAPKPGEKDMKGRDDGRTVLSGRFDAEHETGPRLIREMERKTARELKEAGAAPASADWGGAPDEPKARK